MPQYAAAVCAVAGNAARYETGLVCERRASVGELNVGAVCDGFEEAEEGDFVRRETGLCDGGGSNLGYTDGTASQGGEDEAVWEVTTALEAEWWSRLAHAGWHSQDITSRKAM
jgi:hypothetical protein